LLIIVPKARSHLFKCALVEKSRIFVSITPGGGYPRGEGVGVLRILGVGVRGGGEGQRDMINSL
jgi:hypothetical protein